MDCFPCKSQVIKFHEASLSQTGLRKLQGHVSDTRLHSFLENFMRTCDCASAGGGPEVQLPWLRDCSSDSARSRHGGGGGVVEEASEGRVLWWQLGGTTGGLRPLFSVALTALSSSLQRRLTKRSCAVGDKPSTLNPASQDNAVLELKQSFREFRGLRFRGLGV